ncbi:uncharacterized abhydrolase domain-containing protein DDB_G0269086-like [Paramacrobiotus metropolitanus]|uniref:uncharacterized abhydrolase domain-containing protein DDB_G0269086-like n=1 Tax=Paramacrobiotus metropolitanus TaxID=2943436 RepID=UPI0024461BEE|nr:uncharacterized abhydrolase domain-containing protein DDB_G0269086-like [Paramacrobiotus metropolitanus]
MEQQRGYLESSADEWKVKYERQKEIAKEYLKMADDRTMEGHLAISDLNESMSEESAERSRHLAELKDECDQLRQKVTEAEAKRDEYAANLAEVTQRLTKLATETFKLGNDLKLREEGISTLQHESKGHQKRADEAEKLRDDAIKAMREARDITATEGERLKEEIKKANQENEKVTGDIQKVTKDGLKWQKEARRLDIMVTSLEMKDKEKSQEITKLNAELLEMTTTALAKDVELIAIKNQLRSAAGEYQKLEGDVKQLTEHINKAQEETERVVQKETFKWQDHTRKVKLENTELKLERDDLHLKVRRLEDKNKALQMSNKHKDEPLLQHGVKTAKVESPPPSYSKAHETGKSLHFEMPLRTGTGKGNAVKTEKDGEKVIDDRTSEASAVKGPAKTWFEGEMDIASEDGIEYSITEWMDKFKDKYGDRDEEVLGLLEAYARKFELGKESLDQYYQAMMRFNAKRIITEKQAVRFLIEGCRVDNDLYKALRAQKCKTPTDVKDFFRHWATGEEKYKAPKGQRNQEYVTIRQGQVEPVPQQRGAAAPVQQQTEYRAETPVREVTERVTSIDSQTGQPMTYAMVAAIQAAAQVRPVAQNVAPQNVAPLPPQNMPPSNMGLPQQGNGNGCATRVVGTKQSQTDTTSSPNGFSTGQTSKTSKETEIVLARTTAATAEVATAAAASEKGAEAMAAGIMAVTEAAEMVAAKVTTTTMVVVVAPRTMEAAKTMADSSKEMYKAHNKEVRRFRETGKNKDSGVNDLSEQEDMLDLDEDDKVDEEKEQDIKVRRVKIQRTGLDKDVIRVYSDQRIKLKLSICTRVKVKMGRYAPASTKLMFTPVCKLRLMYSH